MESSASYSYEEEFSYSMEFSASYSYEEEKSHPSEEEFSHSMEFSASYSYEEEKSHPSEEEFSYSMESSASYSYEEEGSAASECSLSCPSGYTLEGSMCLAAHTDLEAMEDAEAACQADGGRGLLAIHGDEDEEDVISYLQSFMDAHPELPDETLFWMGLVEQADGSYEWTDGQAAEFLKFDPRKEQEDNHKERERTCTVIAGGYCKEHLGNWNGKHCWRPFKYICEAEPVETCVAEAPAAAEAAGEGEAAEGAYKVLVTYLLDGKTVGITLAPGDTLDELRHKIEAKEAIQAHKQRLIFGGQQLEAGTPLRDAYGLGPGATVYMVLVKEHVHDHSVAEEGRPQVAATAAAAAGPSMTIINRGSEGVQQQVAAAAASAPAPANDEQGIKVTITTLPSDQSVEFFLASSDTLHELTHKYAAAVGVRADDQRMFYGGKLLQAGVPLVHHYGLADGAALYHVAVAHHTPDPEEEEKQQRAAAAAEEKGDKKEWSEVKEELKNAKEAKEERFREREAELKEDEKVKFMVADLDGEEEVQPLASSKVVESSLFDSFNEQSFQSQGHEAVKWFSLGLVGLAVAFIASRRFDSSRRRSYIPL